MLTFSFCFLERKEHCVLLLERTAYHFFLFSWEDSLPLHSLTWEDVLSFLSLFLRGRLTISLHSYQEYGLQDGFSFLSTILKRKAYHFSYLFLRGRLTRGWLTISLLYFWKERIQFYYLSREVCVSFSRLFRCIGYHFFTSFQFLFLFPVTYFSYHFFSLFPARRSRLAEFQPYLWAVSAVPKDTGPVLKLNIQNSTWERTIVLSLLHLSDETTKI